MAPKDYPPLHRNVLASLSALDLDGLENRAEAEAALASRIENWTLRRFLLTNLAREPDGGFKWQVPLAVLEEYMPIFSKNPLRADDRFKGPSLFVRGALSNYILDRDSHSSAVHFPNYVLSTIRDAGHFVHMDNREAFVTCIRYFHEQQLGKKEV